MKRSSWIVLGLLAFVGAQASAQSDYRFNGHFKYRFNGAQNPDNSVFQDLVGDSTKDHSADLRFNLGWQANAWEAHVNYQFIGLKGDTFRLLRGVPEERLLLANRLPTDRFRLLDLTSEISAGEDYSILHRLDRLWVGHTGDNTTLRLGRQAISWGNGLIYAPMDFFNPFDPAAVDKEYKPGDDMVYGQYAFASGDDAQAVAVFRRDILNRDVTTEASTFAFKYHGFRQRSEFDLLAARHFGDSVVAAGGNRELGDSIWRGDVVLTDGDTKTVLQLVTSLTRSWITAGRNVSGVIEYFYNGFGQQDGNYSPQALVQNPELLQRIARGELFTLARHYVAGGVTVELNPLLLLTPNLFFNMTDGSALFQLVAQADLQQDLLLTGSFSLPIGPDGTEFGGIPSARPGEFLSTGPGLFLQIAAYF